MSEALVPEGYKAIYFHIGKDIWDGELTLVQVDANDDQIQTEIEWEEGSKARRGVLFYPDNADPEERLVLKLDVKPEQAQLVPYAPDTDRANKNVMVFSGDRPIRSSFDEAFTEAIKESIWDRLTVK